ncbi:DUF4239 domain-containing protein [Deinococcus apachensis]|uniref:bestrophin-like domain n=1 Tax=Deinococcus apachensis TaxID=309886 RepID=UPI00039F0ED9|nr:DUF4239 domain-containing protein [Deinococcus apachensis]
MAALMGWLAALLFMLAAMLVSLGGMGLVRRSVRLSTLEEHREVAGFVYAVIGVVYAVLLAFVVIVAWEEQGEARTRVEREANALADLYRGARAFPAEARMARREDLRSYAETVVGREWPALARGGASPETQQAYDGLWAGYLGLSPRTTYENAWYTQALERLNDLGDERRLRLLSSQSRLPGLMWGVLWVGALVTVTFSYFFGVRSAWSQGLIVLSLSGTIALILFLVLALDRPFSGVIRVGPEAFEQVIAIFDRVEQDEAGR